MTPGEIRAAMLADHGAARATIGRAGALAARLRGGEDVRSELRATLGELADSLRAHNAREEELLREVIPTVDAWGPARADVMVQQHRLEHDAMHAAVVAARDGVDDPTAAAPLEALLADVVKHMDREEEAFLSEEVLRDDPVAMYYFGG